MKRYGPALSWDEIADVFDKYSGNGGRQARTCPMYVIVAWAEAHPEIFHVAEDKTFHLIREEGGMSDSRSHLDQINRLLDLLDRREKQLKRVIHSAREWRLMADTRGEIISRLDAENQWHKWPEEKPTIDNGVSDELLIYAAHETWLACYYAGYGWSITGLGDQRDGSIGGVTHWRELPAPPEDV